MARASSAPTRAASRRAASARCSAPRPSRRAASEAASASASAARRVPSSASRSVTRAAAAARRSSSSATSRSSAAARSASSRASSASSASARARPPASGWSSAAWARRTASWASRCSTRSARAARRLARALQAALDAVDGGPGAVGALGQRLPLLRALRERLLRRLPAGGHDAELGLGGVARLARGRAAAEAVARSARRARTASRASSHRASVSWRSRRSWSSAASAWRLSGRRRERASRSTSSARSRLSWVRSSLSWARRRRLRCLPSPAASSMSSRRSFGFDVTIASTRPWETTECISFPRPVSDRTSRTSARRQRAPLSRYSPSPERSSRRRIEISPSGRSSAPSALSRTISTSAADRAWTPRPPPKITSCIDCPRTARGDCSPIAHSTASVTFDLPDPFGPTMTDTPGSKASRVRSGNDLKPLRVIDLRCIRRDPPARGLRGPRARPPARRASSSARRPRQELLADAGGDLEGPVVRRPELGRHLVGDDVAALGEALLQRGLEVDRVLEGVLDLGLEGVDDRLGRAPVARVQEARADDGLGHRGEHALGRDERRGLLADAVGRGGLEALGHAEALGHGPAGAARDGLGADLRQAPGAVALGLQARVERRRHGQAEHAVAQEGEPGVGVRAPLGPGGVREHLAVQVLGQLVEEVAQEPQAQDAAGAWARTKSTAWPTVRTRAACSSVMRTP